jgi:hypothetical protein
MEAHASIIVCHHAEVLVTGQALLKEIPRSSNAYRGVLYIMAVVETPRSVYVAELTTTFFIVCTLLIYSPLVKA